ncbi:MAG: hypothetical protein R3324_13870, partial [Halobacteriales archaeon]|nr:hypothetical protein [Halobacteriales archaeon]
MSRNQLAVVMAVLLVVAAGSAVASPRGSPSLSVFLPDDRVTAGEETTIGIVVMNGGDITTGGSADDEARITTARDVEVRLSAGEAPIKVKTATTPIGNVPEGVTSPVAFEISVHANATPGTYRLPVRLDYRWTNLIVSGDAPNHQENTKRTVEYVTLTIEPQARFIIRQATMGAFLDGAGPVTLTLENVGQETGYASRVTVASDSP